MGRDGREIKPWRDGECEDFYLHHSGIRFMQRLSLKQVLAGSIALCYS